jgi:hypothetical protein
MLRTVGVVFAISVGAGCSQDAPTGDAVPGAEPTAAWVTLFDGTSLDNWSRVGDANWELRDGAVVADAGTGFLLSRDVYSDFDLDLEFFVSADANSGVFLRCANPAEIGAATCYEVNIFDQRPDPAYRTGAIVDVAKPNVMLETGGKWNHYAISARDKHLTVLLNGQTTVDVQNDKFAAGPVALQYGAGQVMFRNVRIRAN